MVQTTPSDERQNELVARLAEARGRVIAEMQRVIVGHDEVLEQMLLALLCRGHCLLEGVPGVAKTIMVQTLAQVLALRFARIQFTPDLMPADITGTDIIQEDPSTGRRQFEFINGPVFANAVLADEINRTPPKTQAALLQAMQERCVTIRGRTYELPDPFFVLATQNPIEHEGTYALPEAQLDRFMFHIRLDYPDHAEECEILRRTCGDEMPVLTRQFSAEELRELQQLVRQVPVPEPVYDMVVQLVQATRPAQTADPQLASWLQWGAGPRAGQMLIRGAKARALLHGRFHASRDDVRALVHPVLRHRLVVGFGALADGIDSDRVIARLLDREAQQHD